MGHMHGMLVHVDHEWTDQEMEDLESAVEGLSDEFRALIAFQITGKDKLMQLCIHSGNTLPQEWDWVCHRQMHQFLKILQKQM